MESQTQSSEEASVPIKEEPQDQTVGEKELPAGYVENDDDNEQQIDGTLTGQDLEVKNALSKCILCTKVFTIEDSPKLLECLHAVCSPCMHSKVSQNAMAESNDPEVVGRVKKYLKNEILLMKTYDLMLFLVDSRSQCYYL